MKFLHIADIHLGVETHGKLNPQTGLNTRFEDFLTTFDKALEMAFEEGIELVVFSGDAYLTQDPTPTQQKAFS